MQEVIVKFKKLSETAHEPTRATPDTAGYDLYASGEQDFYVTHQGKISMIPTGIAVEIPDEYFGVLALRSSMAAKRGYAIPNGSGIIDSEPICRLWCAGMLRDTSSRSQQKTSMS